MIDYFEVTGGTFKQQIIWFPKRKVISQKYVDVVK